MLYFRNDYQVSCIPEINEAFSSLNNQIYEPYGTDSITEHAKEILKRTEYIRDEFFKD